LIGQTSLSGSIQEASTSPNREINHRRRHNIAIVCPKCGKSIEIDEIFKSSPNPSRLRRDTKYTVLFRGCLWLVVAAVSGGFFGDSVYEASDMTIAVEFFSVLGEERMFLTGI
jgi:predicted RNA-binding Zn-ribbon protein involved in translation (DUF1610 family)